MRGGGTGREGAGGEGRRASAGCLPLLRSRARSLGQLRPAGPEQLLGLEVRRGGPSLARRRGAESGRKLDPWGWGRRFAARWHRKRVWPFGREAANSRDRVPLGRLRDKLAGALSWRRRGNLYVLGQQRPSGIQLVSVGSVSELGCVLCS